MQPISDKQKQILSYISKSVSDRGFPPSVREIGIAVGLKSPSTVHYHLTALEETGYIERDSGKTRAISLCGAVERGVPILGSVSAGQPILAIEDALGYLPYDAGDSGEFFALCIKGDSMIEAGILDGDMVIVRSQNTAQSGEIIIALIGDEATCKRLWMKNGQVWLLPENKAYVAIDGTNAAMSILGKVTAVIRTY